MRTDAALALHRLKQNAARLFGNGRAQRIDIAERHLIKAIQQRAVTLDSARVEPGGNRCERSRHLHRF